MMRNSRGSLLIAFMLIVAWATTSEACCWRRARSCGYTYIAAGVRLCRFTGLSKATTVPGVATA